MQSKQWSIAAIADSLENDTGDFGTQKHLQYCRWALELYRQLNYKVLKQVKTVEVPLNAYNAIDYPSDMIVWSKVGVRYGDKVLAIGTAEDIALYHEKDECGEPIKNRHFPSMDEVANGISLDSYCSFHGFGGGAWPDGSIIDNSCVGYSVGIPYKGFFSDDKTKRQLQFSSNVVAKKIYLEYVHDLSCSGVDTVVNPLTYEYLRRGTYWRSIVNKKGVPNYDKEMAERLMEEARLDMVLQLSDINLKDIVNHVRKGISLNPHI